MSAIVDFGLWDLLFMNSWVKMFNAKNNIKPYTQSSMLGKENVFVNLIQWKCGGVSHMNYIYYNVNNLTSQHAVKQKYMHINMI